MSKHCYVIEYKVPDMGDEWGRKARYPTRAEAATAKSLWKQYRPQGKYRIVKELITPAN